jgi:Tol biopolymer transport system component
VWFTAATLAALVWLVAGLGARLFDGARGEPHAVAADLDLPLTFGNMRQLTADDRLEVDPSFSPDGRSIAYAAGTAMHMRVFLRKIDGGTSVPLTREDEIPQFHPRWSPDGRHILYVTPSGAFIALAAGDSKPRRIDSEADAAGAYSGAAPTTARRIFSGAIWSPDGSRVALAYGGSLWTAPANGRGVRQLVGTSPYELHSCDWSPNGRWIACVSGNWSFAGPGGYFGNISPSAIVLLPAAGGAPVELMDRSFVHKSPAWSSDSRRLYFLSNREGASDLYAVPVADDGTRTGEPVRLTTGLAAYAIAFSPDRRHLAYANYSSRSNIWELSIRSTAPIDVTHARPRTTGNQTIEAMRVSRDGRWLLYDSNVRGNFDIYRMELTTGAVERITTDSTDEFAPDLTADGLWLAYHSWRTKSRDVFVRSLKTGLVEQVTSSPFQESLPAWSPNGRALVYLDQLVEDGSARGLFLMRRDRNGQWTRPSLLRAGTSRAAWSFDGRFVTYTRRGSIEVMPVDTGEPQVVYAPADPADPVAGNVQFGPGDRRLYFKSHDSHGRASFWSVPVSGGKPTALVRFTDPTRPSGRTDFAVGEGRFYFTVEDRRSNIWVSDAVER